MARGRLNCGIIVELKEAPEIPGRRDYEGFIVGKPFLSRYPPSNAKGRRALSESEDWSSGGRRIAPNVRPSAPRQVSFDRAELDAILSVYGRKVSEGEWRDYAIDSLEDRAVFSIFRRASEMPMYRVEKVPALARKQGAYRIVAATGLILKRGQELAGVLKVLEKPKLALV